MVTPPAPETGRGVDICRAEERELVGILGDLGSLDVLRDRRSRSIGIWISRSFPRFSRKQGERCAPYRRASPGGAAGPSRPHRQDLPHKPAHMPAVHRSRRLGIPRPRARDPYITASLLENRVKRVHDQNLPGITRRSPTAPLWKQWTGRRWKPWARLLRHPPGTEGRTDDHAQTPHPRPPPRTPPLER